MPRHARKQPAPSTALVQRRTVPELDATHNISTDEAVRLAVKVLQDASAIVPATIADDVASESDDGGETAAPTFIKKLKKLIDDPDIDSVTWTEDGTSFVVREPKRLSEQLVKYFKASKLKSFVRQLHFYGFKKVGGTRYDDWEYNHKYFQQDGCLVHKLRRKTCGPDQQIRNLQSKVVSLQGSLADTQHKLGDMAVALIALLQHRSAATFLGAQHAPQSYQAAPAEDSTPAKRARPSATTAITRFEQPVQQPFRGGGGGGGGGGAVKQEARRLPAPLGYSELLSATFNPAAPMAMALTPSADFDLGAGFDDLFGGDEFGLFPDVETHIAGGRAVGVTAS